VNLQLPWRRGSNRPADVIATPVAAAPLRPARDWASVAPIRAIASRSSALLDPKSFRGDLASTWSTPPALERLGHLLTPEGPAGLLPGLAVPIPAYDAPPLRFAAARDEVALTSAASRSWWPAALSRRARPAAATDTAAGRQQRRPALSGPAAQAAAVSGPDPRRELAATGSAALPEPSPGPESPRSARAAVTDPAAAQSADATAQSPGATAQSPDAAGQSADATAQSPDVTGQSPDAATVVADVARQPVDPALTVARPSGARAPVAVATGAAVRPTLGTLSESRAAVGPQPRPLPRLPADRPAAAVPPAGPAAYGEHWIGDRPAGGPLPIQSSGLAADTVGAPSHGAPQTVPDEESAAAVAGATDAEAVRPAALRRDLPVGSRPLVGRDGDRQGESTRPTPPALLRDLVGTRDLPRALVPRLDVIGAPNNDPGAVRPSGLAATLAAPWRRTERLPEEPAADLSSAPARARSDGAASWVDPLRDVAVAKDLAPPPGLLERLGQATPANDPMSRGVELLGSADQVDGARSPGVELLGGAGPGNDPMSPGVELLGGAVSDERSRPANRALPDLAGLGTPLHQVRRGAARSVQRRVTHGVVWPERASAPIARRTASALDAVASLAARAHPGGDDARAGAPYPSSDHSSTAAPDVQAPAPAPGQPESHAVTPAATPAATAQDVTDVVRRALLLDRERSGSLADLW
jgi:hypothetical protein